MAKGKLVVHNIEINITSVQDHDFICLTDMANAKEGGGLKKLEPLRPKLGSGTAGASFDSPADIGLAISSWSS